MREDVVSNMAAAIGIRLVLSDLPMELILLIAIHLPPSYRVLFALTCKRHWIGLSNSSRAFPPVSDNKGSKILGIPREIPRYFKTRSMSDPMFLQSERWMFLRLLEKDLHDRWQLCHDCFILHPSAVFTTSDKKIVLWSHGNYRLTAKPRERPSSCRTFSQDISKHKLVSRSISGIVDLCPCLSMTPAKRDILQHLKDGQCLADQEEVARRYWHTCRNTYGDTHLKITCWPVFDRADGVLSYHLTYDVFKPYSAQLSCPRRICPHMSLRRAIETWDRPRRHHWIDRQCHPCAECGTNVTDFYRTVVTDFDEGSEAYPAYIQYRLEVDRPLSLGLWGKNVAFPYARQRGYEIEEGKTSREWKELFWRQLRSCWYEKGSNLLGRIQCPIG